MNISTPTKKIRAIEAIATPPSNAPRASAPSSAALLHRDVENDHTISTSAAMGIGVVIGIIGIVLVISLVLFVHRRRTLHLSNSTQRHRKAKLWKGFEPATPNTARTSLMDTKMTNIYLTVLPTPVMPAFLPSPPPKGPPLKGRRKENSDGRARSERGRELEGC